MEFPGALACQMRVASLWQVKTEFELWAKLKEVCGSKVEKVAGSARIFDSPRVVAASVGLPLWNAPLVVLHPWQCSPLQWPKGRVEALQDLRGVSYAAERGSVSVEGKLQCHIWRRRFSVVAGRSSFVGLANWSSGFDVDRQACRCQERDCLGDKGPQVFQRCGVAVSDW